MGINFITNFYSNLFKKIIRKISINKETLYLGTNYGGWSFLPEDTLFGSTIISGGVGEDISFDIEFINKFDAKIIFVDPTPRAVLHLEKVINNLGRKKNKDYQEGGEQEIDSYNLETITKQKIFLEEYALFNKTKNKIKFFLPENPDFVSHSISNWKQNYDKKSQYIEIETETVSNIVKKYNINNLEILKLDIEGAELKVIPEIFRSKIYPKQILVEFDEIQNHSLKAYLKYTYIVIKLILNKYKSIEINNFPNFLFVNKKYININNLI